VTKISIFQTVRNLHHTFVCKSKMQDICIPRQTIITMVTPRLIFVPVFKFCVRYLQRPRKQLSFNCVVYEVRVEAKGTAMELIIHHTAVS
jgi:hypothetical protein